MFRVHASVHCAEKDDHIELCVSCPLAGISKKQVDLARSESRKTIHYVLVREDVTMSLRSILTDPVSLAKLSLDRAHTPSAELICGQVVLSLPPLVESQADEHSAGNKTGGFSFTAALEKEKTSPAIIEQRCKERETSRRDCTLDTETLHRLFATPELEEIGSSLLRNSSGKDHIAPATADTSPPSNSLLWSGRARINLPKVRDVQLGYVLILGITAHPTGNTKSSSQIAEPLNRLPHTHENRSTRHLSAVRKLSMETSTSMEAALPSAPRMFPSASCWARAITWIPSAKVPRSLRGDLDKRLKLPQVQHLALASTNQILHIAENFYRFQIAAFQAYTKFCPLRAAQLRIPLRFVSGIRCPQMSAFIQFLGELHRTVALQKAQIGNKAPMKCDFCAPDPNTLLDILREITATPTLSQLQFELRSAYSTWELEWTDIALLAFIEAPLWAVLRAFMQRMFAYEEGRDVSLDEKLAKEERDMTKELQQLLATTEPSQSNQEGQAMLLRWAAFIERHESHAFLLRRMRVASGIPFLARRLFASDESVLVSHSPSRPRVTLGHLLWSLLPLAQQKAVLQPIDSGRIGVLINKDIAQRQFRCVAQCRLIGDDAAFHLAFQSYDRWFGYTKQQLEAQRQKRLIAAALDRRFLSGNLQLKYYRRWVEWTRIRTRLSKSRACVL